MFNLTDMIKLQMRKNGIYSLSQLVDKLNELGDGKKYYLQHLSDLMIGKNTQINYLYALEKLFNLPENTLVRMADLSCVHKKLIKNGGK